MTELDVDQCKDAAIEGMRNDVDIACEHIDWRLFAGWITVQSALWRWKPESTVSTAQSICLDAGRDAGAVEPVRISVT